jgi:hypothetical protein
MNMTLPVGGYTSLTRQTLFATREELRLAMLDECRFVRQQLYLALGREQYNIERVERYVNDPLIRRAICLMFQHQYFAPGPKEKVVTRRRDPHIPALYHNLQVMDAVAGWLDSRLPTDYAYLRPGSLLYRAVVIIAADHDVGEDSDRVVAKSHSIKEQKEEQQRIADEITRLFGGRHLGKLIARGVLGLTDDPAQIIDNLDKMTKFKEMAKKAAQAGNIFDFYLLAIKIVDTGNNLRSDIELQQHGRLDRDPAAQKSKLKRKAGTTQMRHEIVLPLEGQLGSSLVNVLKELTDGFNKELEALNLPPRWGTRIRNMRKRFVPDLQRFRRRLKWPSP